MPEDVAKGWYHLMRALGDTPVGAVVAFSSIAGRFGNAGQIDYAAANDLLAKLVAKVPVVLTACRELRVRR